MVRPTLIDLIDIKPVELMISLNKCTGSCNVLSPKECVPKETKQINVRLFNIITETKMKLKWLQNIFHLIVAANSIVQYVIQIINGIIKHISVNMKIIARAKKIIVGILAHVSVKIVSF